MKRINTILFCLLVIFALSSCKKEDDKINIYLNQSSIEFNYEESSSKIYISNIGSEDFTWTASTASGFINFSKSTGKCEKNNYDEFEINLKRNEIQGDSVSATVNVTTSLGDNQEIDIIILNYPENKFRFDFSLYDAKYDYINDLLLMRPSYNNNFVAIFDVKNYLLRKINFQDHPLDITIMPQGGIAVVSFQNYSAVTIDIIENKVLETYSINNQSFAEIIGAPNNQVYFLPSYSYDDIGVLDIISGSFTKYSFSISLDINQALLHPTGNYIYGVDYSELIKLNIENQYPAFEYSTYSYDPDGEIWLSKDGLNIFTKSKKRLLINPEISGVDVISEETLPLEDYSLYYIEHNIHNNEYYTITANYKSSNNITGGDKIIILDNNFMPAGTIELEDFYYLLSGEPGYQITNSYANYIFCTSNGNKIIVISQASGYYGGYLWGIEVIER